MAKRFTDTGKWSNPFLRSLLGPYKLLWFYILDDCDHAGIWQVDEDVAQIRIGKEMPIDFELAKSVFRNHIQIIDEGQKWFLNDFIDFQYGVLNPNNRTHLSVLKILEKNKIKLLSSPMLGAMDMVMDKYKDMDKTEESKSEKSEFENALDAFLEMRRKIKKPATPRAIELILLELQKLAPNNNDLKISILEQSTRNNWQDVFQLKEQKYDRILSNKKNLINGIDINKQFK